MASVLRLVWVIVALSLTSLGIYVYANGSWQAIAHGYIPLILISWPVIVASIASVTFIGVRKLKAAEVSRKESDALLRDTANAACEQEARLRAVLETLVDAVITIDERGLVKSFNPAAARIFGYSPEEIIGQSVNLLMPEPHRSQHDGYLERYLKTRIPHIICIGREVIGKRKDGCTFPMELAVNETPVSGRLLFTGIVRDITARKEIERQLQETTRLQRAILDSASYSIIATAVDGTILTMNHAAERMLGYCAEELIGKSSPALFHDPEEVIRCAEELSRELGERIEHGFAVFTAKQSRNMPEEREWTYIRKDGSRFPVALSVTALRDAEQKITGYLGIAYDITKRKRIDNELKLAKEQAEAANRAKSDFLATMSHEIRTPMNAIIGLSHLCLQTELDAKQRDYVAKISHAAGGLLGLINDILDFSKIEAGMLTLEAADFDLDNTLANVDSQAGQLAREKGLRFDSAVAADVPRYLRGDAMRLGQVLLNLAGNAAKFTHKGSVTLSVALKSAGEEAVELEFSVRDSGIGLTAEQVGRLFQPFSQADSSTTRKYGGTGLGLAICKQLVALMGGRIWVESAPAEGSDFRFTARFGRGREIAVSPKEHSSELVAAHARLMGARILLAEDNPFNQQVAKELLEGVGATVVVANNGREALEFLAEKSFDIVLMDVQMPEMDGYEATRRIRATPRLAGQRVIAMTANNMAADRQRCLSAGMDDFIAKPIDPDRLYLALAKWLPERAAPTEEPAPIDLAVLGRMVKNDPDKIRRFALKFLETGHDTLAQMDAAYARRDLTALGDLGHKLKSSARTVGAIGFADLCQALESAGRAGDWPQAKALLPQLPPLLERIAGEVEQKTR